MTSIRLSGVPAACLMLLSNLIIANASGAVVDYTTASLTINPNNIQATSSDGVLVTAYGYHAEFASASSAVVYGPFPTSDNPSGLQYFGTYTGSSSFSNPGLGLLVDTPGPINPAGDDTYGGLYQPGFDNSGAVSAPPSIQFALFTFSEPVDISQVIVDDVSNFGRSIWVAGGIGAPDLSTDLLTLLTTLGVQTSLDDATDGVFAHNISLAAIDYLLVGTPPRDSDYGPLAATGTEQFYINGLDLVPTAVPTPPAVWLLISGLVGLTSTYRRKNTLS